MIFWLEVGPKEVLEPNNTDLYWESKTFIPGDIAFHMHVFSNIHMRNILFPHTTS